MPLFVLHLASDLPPADRNAIRGFADGDGWLSPLPGRVAALLGVAPVDIVLRVIAAPPFTARTRLPSANGRPTIEVSPDSLSPSVLAHEICHALVPARSLLVAEGLANWVANRITGDCGLLFFDSPDYDTVVRQHWSKIPSLSELAEETIDSGYWLGHQSLTTETGRLANAAAASFCGFCLGHWPSFAATARHRDADDPRQAFLAATGTAFTEAEVLWRQAVTVNQRPC